VRRNAAPEPAPVTTAAADPSVYFVQVGAFRSPEEAESQRARLLLSGVQAQVSERDQAGRPMYRVRVGPFQNRDAAERVKTRLAGDGFDAALAGVPR
jgi:cell division protein FtsN